MAYNVPPIQPSDIVEVQEAVQDAGGGLSELYKRHDETLRQIDDYPAQGTHQPKP